MVCPALSQSSFLLYKHPSNAWRKRFSSIQARKDLSVSVRFTMDSAELYSTLSTGRDRLLPKYRHCVAVANLQRYKRTMHILKLEPKKKAGKDLARKERSLGAFERLPPLWSPKGHGSFDGFLEALGTGPYL